MLPWFLVSLSSTASKLKCSSTEQLKATLNLWHNQTSWGLGLYLNSHVGVCEDHVEVLIDHVELFTQLCDQILVHQILLGQTLYGLVILWRKERFSIMRYETEITQRLGKQWLFGNHG